jgi:raffinose/stachyose/melibiose transport system permease protein
MALHFLSKVPIILVVLIWISPFYIALVYSFKTKAEIANTLFAFPVRFYFDNYVKVITENQAFLRGFQNSILSTLFTVGLLSIITPMCSFALARNQRRRFYGLVYLGFVGAILIPWQGIMLPVYVNFKAMGLTNTWWGYVIARTGFQIPICILMTTGFVKGIPLELEESAELEGASMLQVFWRIVYPVMKPVNVTVLLLNTVFAWNDFAVALTMLPKALGRTLPLAQFYYFGNTNQQINLAFAFFILSMLPIIILYLFMQKHIVRGIGSGAVKG